MKKIVNYFYMTSGISMVVFGIWLIINPRTTLAIMIPLTGVILLLNGASEIISHFGEGKALRLSLWYFLDGILSIILGGLVLWNKDIGERFLVLLFAVWVLTSAIFRIIIAFFVKKIKKRVILAVAGILGASLGIVSLFNSTFVSATVAVILGVFFVFQGFSCLSISSLLKGRLR